MSTSETTTQQYFFLKKKKTISNSLIYFCSPRAVSNPNKTPQEIKPGNPRNFASQRTKAMEPCSRWKDSPIEKKHFWVEDWTPTSPGVISDMYGYVIVPWVKYVYVPEIKMKMDVIYYIWCYLIKILIKQGFSTILCQREIKQEYWAMTSLGSYKHITLRNMAKLVVVYG